MLMQVDIYTIYMRTTRTLLKITNSDRLPAFCGQSIVRISMLDAEWWACPTLRQQELWLVEKVPHENKDCILDQGFRIALYVL